MNRQDAKETEHRSVDASLYNTTYFLSECEGYEEFSASEGQFLSNRLTTALAYVDVQPGMKVLDVGCGRGESLIWLAHRGVEVWGLDYATGALRLATSAVQSANLEADHSCYLLFANACRLPFPPESFDRVLMLDIVEHLYPRELARAFVEVQRVLKRGGKLIVHTAPNLWYYQFGYPVFRLFERLRGVHLPKDPRQRFPSHQHVHVNEQSPRSLAQALRRAGFQPRVWLGDTQRRWANQDRLTYMLGWLVTHCYLSKWIFCGDVLSEAYKV